MDESVKHRNLPIVTHDQSPEIADPGDRAFDFPAAFVASQLPSILSFWFLAICPMRANQVDSSFRQSVPQRIGISGLVVNQPWGILAWAASPFPRDGHLFKRGFNERDFIWCGRGKVHSQRNTLAVCHHHKLRTLSTFGLADARAPFFAGENVPSAKVSSHFKRPCSSNSARKVRHTFSQMPVLSQSRSRRQHVLADGNLRFGRSFHRAPLRSTQRMPSKHGRLAIGQGPPLGFGLGSGINGAILAHCASVSSLRCRVMEKSSFP